MNNCICCHSQLIRHLEQDRMYWFCPRCYQEMPNIEKITSAFSWKNKITKFNKSALIVNVE